MQKTRSTSLFFGVMAFLLVSALAGRNAAFCQELSREKKFTPIKVIAHRGLIDDDYPENTLSAITNACQSDVWGIEYDVRMTKDGEAVVCHDADIKRTSNGEGKIYQLTLEELRKFNFGHAKSSQFVCIPTFDSVFDVCNASKKYQIIEIKDGADSPKVTKVEIEQGKHVVDIVASKILSSNAQVRTIIACFTPEILLYVHAKYPGISTMLFIGKRNHKEYFSKAQLKVKPGSEAEHCLMAVNWVSVKQSYLTEEIVKALHNRKIQVGAWGKIDEGEFLRLKDIQADSITLDDLSSITSLQHLGK